MPNIKSQKDRVVQAKKEALHNKAIKSNLKTVVKKADAAISAGAADQRRCCEGCCRRDRQGRGERCASQEHGFPQGFPSGQGRRQSRQVSYAFK